MPTITVAYFELTGFSSGKHVGTKLGEELYDGFKEALIPTFESYPTFCIKKFSGFSNQRWRVESVEKVSAMGFSPVHCEVYLSKARERVPEEYLSQSLKKAKRLANNVLFHGTLVEIDFGFVSSAISPGGNIDFCEGYFDTLQRNEMHKRRLAIVTKASRWTAQVVPVSTVSRDALDKTSFLLTSDLTPLVSYGGGLPSWAVCDMLQTVSTGRILPPLSTYPVGSNTRTGRRASYPYRLNKGDTRSLKSAMAHASGISDYDALHRVAADFDAMEIELKALRNSLENAEVFKAVSLEMQASAEDRIALEALVAERIGNRSTA